MLDGFDVKVVLLEGGPLLAEFERVARTVVRPATPGYRLRRVVGTLPGRLGDGALACVQWTINNRLRRAVGRPNLLYMNTVVSGVALSTLARTPPATVAHVHELGGALDVHARGAGSALQADLVVAVSEPVRLELLKRGIADDRVVTVHESIDTTRWPQTDGSARSQARRRLGIAADDLVVVGAGTIEERKGTDVFLSTALELASSTGPRAMFIWCGRVGDHDLYESLRRRMSDAPEFAQLRFMEEREDMLDLYRSADVFLLTSREDPFPLVALEAASTGLPVIAWAGGGGIPSFVETDAGIVVHDLSPKALAQAVRRLASDEGLRQALGERGAVKVRALHDSRGAAQAIRQQLLRVRAASDREMGQTDGG